MENIYINKIPADLFDFCTFYFFSQGEWLNKFDSHDRVRFGSVISKSVSIFYMIIIFVF